MLIYTKEDPLKKKIEKTYDKKEVREIALKKL